MPRTSTTRTFPTEHSSRRVALTVGYRGTRYAGWARQPGGQTAGRPTLQATLEEALGAVLGHPVRAVAAGRTDAGVHADAQVVSFTTSSSIPTDGLVQALKVHLPGDLWIVTAQDVDFHFDARRSARRRWYRYAVWRGATPDPRWVGACLIHSAPLDLPGMRRAARHLLGRRDFASLAGGWGRDGGAGRTTWRTIYAADWLEPSAAQPLLLFEVCGDAFLRQMVRSMVGGLIWVGEGRWSNEDFAAALAAADRRRMGPAAPAEGLTLWRIEYE